MMDPIMHAMINDHVERSSNCACTHGPMVKRSQLDAKRPKPATLTRVWVTLLAGLTVALSLFALGWWFSS